MKAQQHGQHIQQFQRQFIYNNTLNALQMTEQHILPIDQNIRKMPESIMIESIEHSIQQQKYKYNQKKQIKHLNKLQKNKIKRIFKFSFKLYFLQVMGAYILTLSFMLLNKVLFFPFFQALMIIVIAFSIKPFKKMNMLVLLAVPMSIANYNLGVWILTYPQIVICFISTYIFGQVKLKNLLWILSTFLFALLGFIILPGIGSSIKTKPKLALYYLFPWLQLVFKTGISIINNIILQQNIFLLQIPLFLSGISYGMLLSLSIKDVQFWYILVLLTLDIINSRYQFILGLIKKISKNENHQSIVQAQMSGYSAINSFHLIIFVYIASKLNLNSARLTYVLSNYTQYWYLPLIVWIFLITYETISIVRLKNYQNLMIIGYRDNRYPMAIIRCLGLALGLWFFYLGLGATSEIFFL